MKGDELARSGLNQKLVQPGIVRTGGPAAMMANAKAVANLLVPAFVGNAVIKFKPALPVDPAPLGRIGPLEVRLARKKGDVKRAQKLRYKVFYKDGTAIA